MSRNNRQTLDQIGLKVRTDKSSIKHNYTRLYAAYFEPLRDKPIRLLEIGVAGGASLKMWKEYFSQARIIGMDIYDCRMFEEDRVAVVQGDQSDPAFLKKISEEYGPFDIVIDDGSHMNSDMIASFECLFPLLKPGGLCVVEDLHACYWKDIQAADKQSFADKLKELVDLVNSGGKSGTANRSLDKVDPHHKAHKTVLSAWEDSIEFVHLYRSIVFIRKHLAERQGYTYLVDMPWLFERVRRKIRVTWKRLLSLDEIERGTG